VDRAPLQPFTARTTRQLVRVDYRRPETWRFLLYARLLSTSAEPGDLQNALVFVTFAVSLGLGRSMSRLPQFQLFQWGWSNSSNSPFFLTNFEADAQAARNPILCDFAYGAPLIDDRRSGGSVSEPKEIRHVVAESINVAATVNLASDFSHQMQIEVGAYFSPQTHVRPEWNSRVYSGGENGS
jgi:hypothetical protein